MWVSRAEPGIVANDDGNLGSSMSTTVESHKWVLIVGAIILVSRPRA